MRIIPVFVPHEGCPHDCIFCNQRRIAAQKAPTAEEVAEEIQLALERSGEGAQVAFYGGSFTAIPEIRQTELLEAALPFVREGRVSSLRVSTRPDAVSDDVLERLRRYGVDTIELGAQSMCDDVLMMSARGHTADDTRKAAKAVKNAGFKLVLQTMTGLPLDTDEKSVYTARETAKLMPDAVRIYPVAVIKDSVLCDMYERGEYRALSVREGAYRASLMLEVFLRHNIQVIRIGLNPTEELSNGSVEAGAYHPALGEMAMSCIYLRAAQNALGQNAEGEITLLVSPGAVSKMTGVKRENMEYLKKKYPNARLKIQTDSAVSPYEVRVVTQKE